jgi:hypothetical protein
MNMVDVTAVAQSKLPSSKMAFASKNTRLTEKSLYDFPKTNWKAQEQSLNAEEYQPTSAAVWK